MRVFQLFAISVSAQSLWGADQDNPWKDEVVVEYNPSALEEVMDRMYRVDDFVELFSHLRMLQNEPVELFDVRERQLWARTKRTVLRAIIFTARTFLENITNEEAMDQVKNAANAVSAELRSALKCKEILQYIENPPMKNWCVWSRYLCSRHICPDSIIHDIFLYIDGPSVVRPDLDCTLPRAAKDALTQTLNGRFVESAKAYRRFTKEQMGGYINGISDLRELILLAELELEQEA